MKITGFDQPRDPAIGSTLSAPRKDRALTTAEIGALRRGGNCATTWSEVRVTDPFLPICIRNCRFLGPVRLGRLVPGERVLDGLAFPFGLRDTVFQDCILGDDVVIERVACLARTVVESEAVLFDIGRLATTPDATFGYGILRGAMQEADRLRLTLGNEAGGREILPFAGMQAADAFLWSRPRGDRALMARLTDLTDALAESLDTFSRIGRGAVVRHCRVLVDVRIGDGARLDGVERAQNLTILSDESEPSVLCDGTVAVDGIVGYGCRLGAHVDARGFVLGSQVHLGSGLRLENSFVGDNARLAGGEVQSCLLAPIHEQHHSSSFLIAATLEGQSNLAAGAVIGSNHNSRSPDGEIRAGRGFWPGLCSSFKHNCRFAAYTLVAKGDYPAELHIPLPFALVANAPVGDALHVMPAYWFLYNMYALRRNEWKFRARDLRVHDDQRIETEALAPDTVEQIVEALALLELWTGAAALAQDAASPDEAARAAMRQYGRELLANGPKEVARLTVLAPGIEHSRRPVRVLKVAEAWAMYREMVHWYAIRTLLDYMDARWLYHPADLVPLLLAPCERRWINLGGQLVAGGDYDCLRDDIVEGRLDSWAAIHARYETLWQDYPEQMAIHAAGTLLALHECPVARIDAAAWRQWLERALQTQQRIAALTRQTRSKDFENPFRALVYDTPQEMDAVLGSVQADPFLARLNEETEEFSARVQRSLQT